MQITGVRMCMQISQGDGALYTNKIMGGSICKYTSGGDLDANDLLKARLFTNNTPGSRDLSANHHLGAGIHT